MKVSSYHLLIRRRIRGPKCHFLFRVRAAVPALLHRPDVVGRRRQGGGRRQRGLRPLLGTAALLAGGHNQIPHHEEGHQKVTQGAWGTDDQYQSGFFLGSCGQIFYLLDQK